MSTGAAAEWAGVPKPLFLTKLSEFGVDTFSLEADELRQDVAVARGHL
jgi:predicted HTH domain antitoxin